MPGGGGGKPPGGGGGPPIPPGPIPGGGGGKPPGGGGGIPAQAHSAYVSICQHTSAHVSIRQHRQDTSAHVRIRQHMSAGGGETLQAEEAFCAFMDDNVQEFSYFFLEFCVLREGLTKLSHAS
jgi:hypothetical protein